MAEDLNVVLENIEPETIVVEVGDPQPAEIQVEVFDAGLVGASGPVGPSNIGLITDHVNSENPHPNYDDGSSLVLLYENAKV